MKTKYIVGELPSAMGTVLGGIAFPEFVNHADMAKMFNSVESAGFLSLGPDIDKDCGINVVCYGESIGLKLKADPERDAKIMRRALGLTY